MAEAVSRRPVWRRTEFSARLVPVGCVVDRMALERLTPSSSKTLLSASFAVYSQLVDMM